MTALVFRSASDPAVEVVLTEALDLPQSGIRFGNKVRREITDYGERNAKSVQILGDEFDPISLNGTWDDWQTGDFGRAERLARAFEALSDRAEIVVVEWGSYVRWGLLDFWVEYMHPNKVEWQIEFEPLYKNPPQFQRLPAAPTPPGDQSAAISDLAADMSRIVAAPPETVEPGLLLQLQLGIASIENSIASAAGVLEGITGRVELTEDIAGRAARLLYSPIRVVNSLRARTRNATLGTISTAQGAAAAAVRLWTDEIDERMTFTRRALIELLREMVDYQRPTGFRTIAVRDNETLMTIAARVYGDYSAWTRIADANNLDSPTVAAGTQIVLPDEVS